MAYQRLGEREGKVAYYRTCMCGVDIETVAPPGPRACPMCGTTYELRHLPAPIFAGRNGFYLWGRRCDCERRERERKAREAEAVALQDRLFGLFRASGIPARYAQTSLQGFIRRPGTEEALDRCRDFVENFATWHAAGRGLLLVGPNRSGKTHLLTACVNTLVARFLPALYIRMIDYLDALRRAYRAETAGIPRDEALEQEAATVDLVALDDLGTERLPYDDRGDWVRERLYKLVDSRYVGMRPMLVTTNCTRDEIEGRLGLRILRRLDDMLDPVEILGDHSEWLVKQAGTSPGEKP